MTKEKSTGTSKQAEVNQKKSVYIKGKALLPMQKFKDIREILRWRVETTPDKEAYIFRKGQNRETVKKTYRQLYEDINNFGEALLAEKIVTIGRKEEPLGDKLLMRPLDAMATMGKNTYTWVLSHQAAVFGAAVAVPIDRDLHIDEATGLCRRAEVKVLSFTDSHREQAYEILKRCATIETMIDLEGEKTDKIVEVETLEDENSTRSGNQAEKIRKIRIVSLDILMQKGKELRLAGSSKFEDLTIYPEDVASIFFTSGTTANSKGVMLSHKNITSDLWGGLSIIRLKGDKRTLSILPLHHTFENTVGMYGLWILGVCICFNDGLRHMMSNMKEWNVESLMTVPLLLETIHRRIMSQARKTGKDKALKRLIAFSNGLRKIKIDLRKPLFKKIRQAVSPDLQTFFIGGSALKPEYHKFFEDIGYEMWVTYGLTEAAPGVAGGNEGLALPSSVGILCPGYELRIEYDAVNENNIPVGEIELRSDTIMLGYYRDPETTAKVLSDDGWLKTGDLGYVKDERIYLTGRAKSMIVLDNGKNIFPEEIEEKLQELSIVKEAMLWPQKNKRGQVELCVRFQLDEDEVKLMSSEEITKTLDSFISDLNAKMPSYKHIRAYLYSDSDMIKTATGKVKRREEIKLIQDFLEQEGKEMREVSGQELKIKP